MKNVPENELFSAYVDGELTAAEQAEVERLLASSPAARRLVDDLRAISSALQALPVQKLDADLSREVLRLAEHRMLSGRDDSDADFGEPSRGPGRWRAFVQRWTRPRIWIWPAVAVAVSLLLVVFQPDQGRRREPAPDRKIVAMAPPKREASEPPAIGARVADADRRAALAETERSAGMAGEEKPAFASEAARDAAKGPMGAAPAPASASKAPALASPADVKAISAPLAPAAAPAPALSMKAPAEPMKPAQPASAALSDSEKNSVDEVTVVYCDVAPEAIPFVEQVLAKRQIAVATLAMDRRRGRAPAAMDRAAKAESARRPEGVNGVPSRPSPKPAEKAADVDVQGFVWLQAEATPQQLETVLAELRSQPQLVRSVADARIAGPVADGDWESLLRSAVVPAVKPNEFGLAETAASPAARRAKADAPWAGASRKAFGRVKSDGTGQAQSAGGKGAMVPPEDVPQREETTDARAGQSAANREAAVQSQSGAAVQAEQQTRSLQSPTLRKALKTEGVAGKRAALQASDAQAVQAPQASQETRAPSITPELDKAGSTAVKRRVIFVLRPVEPSSGGSDRANQPAEKPATPAPKLP